MDELPELPFEKVLSYLSLEDRLKSRSVARAWRNRIDSFRVRSLCFSKHPTGFICGSGRWVSGSFAHNFISSPRFEQFVNTFRSSILSNLKHLRLCELTIQIKTETAFAQAINSFGQLEEFDLIRINRYNAKPDMEFELNLPKLRSILLERVYRVRTLRLNAPLLLKNVKLWCCASLRLDLVHGESVERLIADVDHHAVEKMKNLKVLYTSYGRKFDSIFLSFMKQLVEIHLNNRVGVVKFFEQKQQYGRADLKIYLCGHLLDGPNDQLMTKPILTYLAADPLRLEQMDDVPLCSALLYREIEALALGSEFALLNRFTDLTQLTVAKPVRDLRRFLNLLKSFPNIVTLRFSCDQPPELFRWLPEYCTVQELSICKAVKDFRFLFAFKHLIKLHIPFSYVPAIAQFVERVFEELHFLLEYKFYYRGKPVKIECNRSIGGNHKEYQVWVTENYCGTGRQIFTDINAAIRFFIEDSSKKRKADEMRKI